MPRGSSPIPPAPTSARIRAMKLLPLLLLLAAAPVCAASPEPEVLMRVSGVVWGFDFLPDGRVLFTQREGKMGLLDPRTGEVAKVTGAPEVWAKGQGGLLDVKLHPGFRKNGLVYLTWSQPVEDGAATALGRARLAGKKLEGLERLFLSNGGGRNGEHFGSRILFDGPYLYLTLGERGHRHLAQDLSRHNGKVLRLTHEGKPAGCGVSAERPEVWTWGHRNPQGIDKRPGTDEVWEDEFGPRGGDELNLLKAGANYGWPVITYGREYWGPSIGTTAKEGLEQPAAHWEPVISPSGMAFLDRDRLVLACLNTNQLRLVTLKGDAVAEQSALFAREGWRFRQVRLGPDKRVWFSTDEGLIGRLPQPERR